MNFELTEDQQTIRTMARGAGIVLLGTIIARVLGYVFRVVLKRYLGLADFGLISAVIAIIEMVTIVALLGLPGAVSRYISYYRARKAPDKEGAVILIAFLLTIGASIFAGLAIYFSAPFLCNVLFKKPEMLPMLKILWLAIIPYTFQFIIADIFRGYKQMRLMMLVQPLGRNIFLLLGFIGAILISSGMTAAVWGNLSGYVLGTVFALILLRQNVRIHAVSHSDKNKILHELVAFSWPLVFSTIFWNTTSRIDVFFLTIYASKEQVGVYNALLPLSQFVPVAMQSFITIFMPIIASIFARGTLAQIQGIYSASTKWIYSFTLIIFFPIFVFSGPILEIFFGADTLGGSLPLRVVAVGYLIHSVLGPANQVLHAAAKTKWILFNTFFAFMLNVILDLILIPRYNILGAAIAATVAFASVNVTAIVENYRLYRVHPFGKAFLKNLAFTGFILIAVMLLSDLLRLPAHPLALVLIYLAFLGVYTFLIVLPNLDENDRIIIEAVENKFRIRLDFIKRQIRVKNFK